METETFGSRIARAFEADIPEESVNRVKSTVAAELRALDPRVRVKPTEYFNHSYVPDLVASWPERPDAAERYIYLKFNSELDYLFEDLTLVKEKKPIIFGLSPTPRLATPSLQRLTHASLESNTLLTDADGIEALIDARSSKVLELVTSALAQGGRGLLDQPAARQTSGFIRSGFEGARRVERLTTSRAASTIDTYLDQARSGTLMSLLQAVWVGSGGRLEDFPGRKDIGASIDDDALDFLLQLDPVDDEEFWRRVGEKVPLEQLVRLDLPHGSENLDKLMTANASHYTARYCKVKTESRNLFDADRPPIFWFVDRRVLGMKGFNFAAYVTEHVDEFRRVSPDRRSGIPLSELLPRTEGMNLTELELSVGARTIRYASSDKSDVVRDPALHQLQESLGKPFVRSTAVTVGDHQVYCDFTSRTARGSVSTSLELRQLLSIAIRLFENLTQLEAEAMSKLLRA